MTAGHNRPAVDDQAGVVQAGQGHRKARAVLVAMVQADQAIVAVAADHALGPIGDHVPRRQAGVAAFVALRDVVADRRHAEGEPQQARLAAAFGDPFGQLVGVDVAQIAVQQRHADADLSLGQIVFGQAQSVVKGVDAALPAVRQPAAVPIQMRGHGLVSVSVWIGVWGVRLDRDCTRWVPHVTSTGQGGKFHARTRSREGKRESEGSSTEL